jgi:hypothetical protein
MRYPGTQPLMRRMQAIDQVHRARKWPTDKTLAKDRVLPAGVQKPPPVPAQRLDSAHRRFFQRHSATERRIGSRVLSVGGYPSMGREYQSKEVAESAPFPCQLAPTQRARSSDTASAVVYAGHHLVTKCRR